MLLSFGCREHMNMKVRLIKHLNKRHDSSTTTSHNQHRHQCQDIQSHSNEAETHRFRRRKSPLVAPLHTRGYDADTEQTQQHKDRRHTTWPPRALIVLDCVIVMIVVATSRVRRCGDKQQRRSSSSPITSLRVARAAGRHKRRARVEQTHVSVQYHDCDSSSSSPNIAVGRRCRVTSDSHRR